MEDLWADAPRQAWRSFRKKLGLAASSDVQIISELVKKLLALNEPSLPYVMISYPGIPALYKEDIVDTADYLGLQRLKGLYKYHPREVYAAYAGHRLGLCEHIDDKDRCKDEGYQLPVRETLLVEYTDQAILLHTTALREAIDPDRGDSYTHATASFELGAGSKADKHASDVAEFVYQFLEQWYQAPLIPDELLVIMTGITDETIQEVIREAVGRVLPNVQLLTSRSEYVASRGSAELAWRANIMELS